MNIILGCEFSGIVRDAFRKRGHNAWSCDLLDTEIPGPHIVGNILDHLHNGWDLGIFHPPCTFFTNSGVRWLWEDPQRWISLFDAAEFFNALKNAPIKKIALENPVPHKYARALIGDYSQKIQPYMFGHAETKATCLWLKNLPPLTETNNVYEQMMSLPKNESNRVHYASPGPERWKIRSRTYTGIAEAMAEQWGS